VKSVDEWRPIAGSLEAIACLVGAGFRVVVVSNQSGLARGLFDRDALAAIHAEMERQIAAAGGRIEAIFFCPHAPDEGCRCRKPAPGLLDDVAQSLGTSVSGAPLVGDKADDLEAARRAGCEPILVRTGKGAATEWAAEGLSGALVFDDLRAVADYLIDRDSGR
jgi:D-glycero-D-manno-heptose 1,7-bisphosphate phosphatase